MKKYQILVKTFSDTIYFKEAVIHTDKYKNILIKELENLLIKIPLNLSHDKIIDLLNNIYISYKISFQSLDIDLEKSKNGLLKGKTKSDLSIIIYTCRDISTLFNNRFLFSKFVDTLSLLLQHELVHKGQFIQSFKNVHIDKKVDLYSVQDKKYYSDKHELMAMANMIIEELRFNGYSNNDILKYLKTDY